MSALSRTMGLDRSMYRRIFSSDGYATLVVCSAIFTDAFIYDLIIPFLPQMLKDRAGVPDDTTQFWTSMLLSSFGFSFLVGNLVVGALADWVRSKRLLFLFGMLVMTASSLVLFLGTHVAVLLVGRGLQGVSASLVWVSGLAFLTSHVDKGYIGWAMGMTSVAMGAGELVGPAIGGVMYEHAGHFAVLGLVCAIIAVDTIMRFLMKDKSPETHSASSSSDEGNDADEERALLPDNRAKRSGASQNSDSDDAQPPQHQKTINIFGLEFDRDLSASCYAVAANSIILFSLEATLVNFVRQNFGWSTSASGGLIFAYVSPTLLSPVISGITTRYGPRWLSVIFFTVGGGGLLGLGFLTEPNKAIQVFFVIVIVIIGSCAGALTTIHHIAFGVATKRKEDQAKREGKGSATGTGKSFGSLTTAWAVGTCLGPIIAALLLGKLNWLIFCVFLACLSVVSAGVMVFTWTAWEDPGEDE